MSRAVPEWVATHDDQPIPARVKLRLCEACGGKCALSGRKLGPGEYDFDHIKPLKDGGDHREGNLQVIARDKHREKTADENSQRAKETRVRLKHLGLWKSKGPKIASRRFNGAVVPRSSNKGQQP